MDLLYTDSTLNIVFDTLKKGKQVIVFANTKMSAEKCAEEIAKKIKEKNVAYSKLSEDALKALSSSTKQCRRLAKCLEKGIAFHHAGLASKQKELIEDNFREKVIKVIACTPSLAIGVDLPAYRVVLKDLRRFSARGLQYIPVLEYKQMAGRAGRPKFDSKGEAIIIASSESQKEELIEKYINGESEAIYSKLAVEPVLRTYVLSLIATGFVTTKKDLFDFFSETFWAKQFQDMSKLRNKIDNVLVMLEEWEFISNSEGNSDFKSALDLEKGKYRATILGKRVAELYIDPYTANYLKEMLQRGMDGVTTFSLLHVISSTLEIRPKIKARVKDMDKIDEFLVKHVGDLLDKEPSIYEPEYDDFLNAIRTAMFFNDWIDEQSEDWLLEEYKVRPGEIKVKLDLADWLVYCMEEFCRILSFKQLIPELKKLRIRLKNGVREELLALLKFKGIGRVRARKLFGNQIKDVKNVKDADLMKLIQILGRNTALNIKKQVGQEFKGVPKGKRIGQTGLKKWQG